MNEKPLIIYHGGCWDGFCAAWLFHKVYPDAEFVPAQYGQPAPDCAGREVYIVDFSYKRDVMQTIISHAEKVVVLDHHESAQKELAGLEDMQPTFGEPPLIRFDLTKSGGRLAWEYITRVRHNTSVPEKYAAPWLVDYTEDRDLWKWALPESREINAALRSYPLDFALWDELSVENYVLNRLTAEGRAILRCESQLIEAAVGHAREIDFLDNCPKCNQRGDVIAGSACGQCRDGKLTHKVLCVNATCLVSDVAGKLAEGRPFGVVYFDADGKRIYSLRSKPDGLNVAEIAARRGGGGHRHAAGFEMEIPQ